MPRATQNSMRAGHPDLPLQEADHSDGAAQSEPEASSVAPTIGFLSGSVIPPSHSSLFAGSSHTQRPPTQASSESAPDQNLLTDVLHDLSQSLRNRETRPRARDPEPFTGSDPKLLRAFMVQCELVFRDRPEAFASDIAKVTYAMSFLRDSALGQFENSILHPDIPSPNTATYRAFTSALQRAHGPHDPIADAERSLTRLEMKDNHHSVRYLTDFSRHAALLDWNESALRHRLYEGLPARLKDEICRVGKPATYDDMRELIQVLDARYWERERERSASGPSKQTSEKSSKKRNDSAPKNATSAPRSDNRSAQSSASGSSKKKSKSPDLSKKLKDGKITAQERQHRVEKDLCLYCGGQGHKVNECPKKPSSSRTQARSAALLPPYQPPPEAPASAPAAGKD